MKVIAFFNLKKETDINQFNDWVQSTQTPAFKAKLPLMSNFKVSKLTHADNYNNPPQIVQTFDWNGTEQQWRDTIASFQTNKDTELFNTAKQWLKFCDEDSTKILYANNIKH